MAEPAIRAVSLGKRYRVPLARRPPDTARDALAQAFRRGAERLAKGWRGASPRRGDETFWALHDVSLEVARGEVVGLVGPNGAGKSTLLKMLARITEPTAGHAEIRGRVGSLLEVGTGFHSELTGRENVFLNGAILGMRRSETAARFDEIVAFAEVERFIDMPVKHYSSGMSLRLAFAVAAHLEAEILMVDEVLAVGDTRFQAKCLGKMQDLSGRGSRTVLVVSHNLTAVRRLCTRCVLLHEGTVADDGPTDEVIARYLGSSSIVSTTEWIHLEQVPRTGSGSVRFTAIRVAGDGEVGLPRSQGPLEVRVALESDGTRRLEGLAITLYDAGGGKLVNADALALGRTVTLPPGRSVLRFSIASLHLNPGTYSLGFWAQEADGTICDFSERALRLEVVPSGDSGAPLPVRSDGVVPCRFTLEEAAE